jgi:hypothetical protein
MRRLSQLVLVAFLAAGCFFAAACGSSDGTAEKSATTTGLSESAQLVEYLGLIEPRQERLDKLRGDVLAAVDDVHVQTPDRSWDRAAVRLSKVTTGLDRLSIAVLDVKAPAKLKSAHQDLAESIAVIESYVFNVKNALSTRIPTALAAAVTEDSTRMAVLRGTWEAAVTDYAHRLGVTLPAWLGGPGLAA